MPDVVAAKPGWLWFAIGSAVFLSATTILGKLGLRDVNANVVTFIRVVVMFVMVLAVVALRHEWEKFSQISTRNWVLIIASGLTTGLAWLCYFYALELAPASRVEPVDKLSVAIVIVVGIAVLGEPFSWQIAVGSLLIIAGIVFISWGGAP
jgi:transporter family protein